MKTTGVDKIVQGLEDESVLKFLKYKNKTLEPALERKLNREYGSKFDDKKSPADFEKEILGSW